MRGQDIYQNAATYSWNDTLQSLWHKQETSIKLQ